MLEPVPNIKGIALSFCAFKKVAGKRIDKFIVSFNKKLNLFKILGYT